MSIASDKINRQLDNDVILFSNKEEYLEFLKNMASLFTPENTNTNSVHIRTYERTCLRCIEDIESFFGITFGDPDSDAYQNGNVDMADIRIEFEDLQPKQFPCLLVTASLACLSDGSHKVNYCDNPIYVYKSDFTVKCVKTRSEFGSTFWQIRNDWTVGVSIDTYSMQDTQLWEAGNYFETKAEAQKYAEQIKNLCKSTSNKE